MLYQPVRPLMYQHIERLARVLQTPKVLRFASLSAVTPRFFLSSPESVFPQTCKTSIKKPETKV